jgi:hypothetical protein
MAYLCLQTHSELGHYMLTNWVGNPPKQSTLLQAKAQHTVADELERQEGGMLKGFPA